MSKLEEQRKAKKKLGEQIEIIETLGQDSEKKGAKAALEIQKKEYEEKERKDILTVEKLDSAYKRPSKETYYKSLLDECNLRMTEYRLPIGFKWIAKVSQEGLAIYLGTPLGQYGGGVKIVEDPFKDAKGMVGLINQALMDVEAIENQWKIQSSIKTKN